MTNIEELNLITEKINEKPNYSLENKLTSIEVYFNAMGRVLIVGVIDNNYIYWASLTDSDDEEINSCVFDYISKGNIRKVSHLYKVLKEIGISFQEVKSWTKVRLVRKADDRMYWITPFDANYGSGQTQHNGKFFARDIKHYMKRVHEKCRFREADGAYERVLDYYLSVFKQDDGNANFYFKIKKLLEIIESEDYLYGSENFAIRTKYIELRELGENLYNRYMSAAR